VGNSLAGIGGDPCFKLLEVIGHGIVLFARLNSANLLQLQSKSAAGKMDAEDIENGCSRDDGQISPDGEEPVVLSQQPAWSGVRPWPRDVTADVQAETAADRRASASHDLDRSARIERPAEEEIGLWMSVARFVEHAAQSG
jgi:hypothetical protein